MPGILPMKVIKVGTSSQSRIAQACDRCRSKKIRCDGFRPCCSQCANVGFECKTSDKLSRRAFPRGYTESLEERVRALESEVRELKDLLDEKDEKIDMLSRVQSQSGRRTSSTRRTSSSSSSGAPVEARELAQLEKHDVFKVQQSPFLLDEDDRDAYFMGTSSGRSFIDAFKRKVQETGRSCAGLDTDVFFPSVHAPSPESSPFPARSIAWTAPPRLVSDQMINIYFQEWAPLFPVIHRPTFLMLYTKHMTDPTSVDDAKSMAQLNLVFGIAALSSPSRLAHDIELCERQWQSALESFMLETSLASLQCLILAQIYCMQKGDFSKLLHYKSLSVGISQRLGLHQSQKRFALGALTSETRKKVFWTLYTLDCFSAASMGLPKCIKESDVHCEYPVDADDEYVTEQGFQPTLPGEATKVSAALALFRGCRLLAKTLDELYPASPAYDVSLRNVTALSDELDEWSRNLPSHLRLCFDQDKPSTNVISSRCPLLSLTYHYIKTLIHRPVVCASIGDRSSSSILALASSSKSIVQIIKLLDERSLSFSYCLNRNELLGLCGFGLLFQVLDLDKDGKLIQDSQRLICSVIELLDRGLAPGASEFRRIGCAMVSVGKGLKSDASAASPMKTSDKSMSPPQRHPQINASDMGSSAAQPASSATKGQKQHQTQAGNGRRATGPSLRVDGPKREPKASSKRQPTVTPAASVHSEPMPSLHPRSKSTPSNLTAPSPSLQRSPLSADGTTPNLDYFSFPNDPTPPSSRGHSGAQPPEWERLLGSIDDSHQAMFENLYVSPKSSSEELTQKLHQLTASPDNNTVSGLPPHSDWSSPNDWTTLLAIDGLTSGAPAPAASVLSFSDESLTSGEEFSSIDVGLGSTSHSGSEKAAYRGIIMPTYGGDAPDGLEFDQLSAADVGL